MVAKTDFLSALRGQYAIDRTRKNPAVALLWPVMKLISNAGLVILTFFAVFSGFPGSREDMTQIGVSLGPNHL